MSQKKVGTVSLYGFVNYGNYLQNYAVHAIWSRMGYAPTLLAFQDDSKSNPLRSQARMIVRRILTYLPNKRKRFWKRFFALHKFTTSTLSVRSVRLDRPEEMKGLSSEFTYFSVGSDQIWNPNYIKANHYESVCFLSFAQHHQRVCMVPSFGVSRLPKDAEPLFAAGLAGFDRFNVREEDGALIIKELMGKEAEVLVDPTMALTRDEWSAFTQQSCRYDEKKGYLLLYLLGDISSEDRSSMEALANKRGLSIVDMLDPNDEAYTSLPPDFVRLISNADLVCTDSFHASVFSIIFNRAFVMFERNSGANNMNSRASTLLRKFSLEERKAEIVQWDDSVFSCSFQQANKILTEERQRLLSAIQGRLE